ncbi:MAG: hypothetical protein LH479_08745 [Polaromonas sp.]|nr:hypothetical protein [Polaromonas sp.]
MKPLKLCATVTAAWALALAAPVAAQSVTAPAAAARSEAAQQPPASRSPAAAVAAGFDTPVANADLAGYRGGMAVVHSDMQLDGTTAGNTALNVATGTNAISAGAFANMSGLPIVIQNSGANVLIQNAVILNLQIN